MKHQPEARCCAPGHALKKAFLATLDRNVAGGCPYDAAYKIDFFDADAKDFSADINKLRLAVVVEGYRPGRRANHIPARKWWTLGKRPQLIFELLHAHA